MFGVYILIGNLYNLKEKIIIFAPKYIKIKVIFNDFFYLMGDNDQFQDRIHRINQTEDVDIYFQIFRDTQYEKMWEIVLKKGYVIDQIIKKEDEK